MPFYCELVKIFNLSNMKWMLAFVFLFKALLVLGLDCQKVADSYCELNCLPSIEGRGCGANLVALKSGPGSSSYRCYSPEALNDYDDSYTSGDCYCTRNSALNALFAECKVRL